MSSKDDPTDSWPAAWFFIPMPEPLGLPHDYHVEGLRTPSGAELASQGAVAHLDVSMKVHQQQTREPQTMRPLKELFDLAAEAVQAAPRTSDDHEDEDGPAAVRENRFGRRTVLEVMVPLRAEDDEALTEAFDRGLEAVRVVQRAYATFTQRPLKLSTLRNLPVAVPVSQGQLWLEEEGLRPEMGPLAMFRVNVFAVASDTPHPIFSETELEQFGVALDQLSRGSPFDTYAEIRREGWVQRDYEGNTRLAGLLAGVAGEVLLDTLLLHLMWEERVAPESAAAVFNSNFHKTRVTAHYHERLGGNWQANGTSPVARYLSELAPLRHRIAHGGHEPSRADVRHAYELLMQLEHYIGDLLASDRGRREHPRTAVAWLGQPGLDRRDAWTRRMRELASDPDEPDWIDTFGRWKFFADRAREQVSTPPGSDPATLDLMAELHPDGSVTWLLHDRDQHMAARLDGGAVVDTPQLEALEAHRSALPDHWGQTERVGMAFDPARVPDDLEWSPEHVYIPELSIYLPPPS